MKALLLASAAACAASSAWAQSSPDATPSWVSEVVITGAQPRSAYVTLKARF